MVGFKGQLARRLCALFFSALMIAVLCLPAAAEEVVIKTQAAADNVKNGIRGVDVSEYQGKIDWEAVADDNISFAMVRATAGMTRDKYFEANYKGAKAAGLYVGAYHYARFTSEKTMKAEAEHFLEQLEGKKLTYPVVLDIEHNISNQKVSKAKLTGLCVKFLEIMKKNGHTVMLYTGTNFLKDRLDASKLKSYNLWAANYIEEPNQGQKMWQHTSYGEVDGIAGRALIDIAYTDLSRKKTINVDNAISTSIKRTLNERYNAGLPLDSLDMAEMKAAVVSALQSELARQFGANLNSSGKMDAATLELLNSIAFTQGKTNGDIEYLMQAMLFYKGLYTQPLTGAFDEHTAEALAQYQAGIGVTASGVADSKTLWNLFL